MMHATSLDESQFGGVSEHSHAPFVPILCDYCDSFDHDVDTCLLLSSRHRLEALAAFNMDFTYRVYSRLTLGPAMTMMLGVRH